MKTKLFIILLALIALVGCNSKQPSSSTITNTYVTNPVTAGGTTTTTTTTTSPAGCDGIPRTNAASCYYKNIPTVQVSGGVYGSRFWISTNLPANVSQNQFVTDASFNVRVIARRPSAGQKSTFNRDCSPFMLDNSKKLRVKLQLYKPGLSPGEEATLTSDIDVPSKVWHFTPPRGATQPFVLEVVNVESDSRCSGLTGTALPSCPGYFDIPINTYNNNTAPTECAAFDIQFSTDDTYDLPGASAN